MQYHDLTRRKSDPSDQGQQKTGDFQQDHDVPLERHGLGVMVIPPPAPGLPLRLAFWSAIRGVFRRGAIGPCPPFGPKNIKLHNENAFLTTSL